MLVLIEFGAVVKIFLLIIEPQKSKTETENHGSILLMSIQILDCKGNLPDNGATQLEILQTPTSLSHLPGGSRH